MASVYGYITVADLERSAGKDYSAINAKYTDSIIEAQITGAEQYVRSQFKKIPSSATEGMVLATKIMAKRFMHNLLVSDGRAEPEIKALITIQDGIIDSCLKKDDYSPAGSVPMTGAEPY